MIIAIDVDNTILSNRTLGYKIATLFESCPSLFPSRSVEVGIWDRHKDNLIVKAIARLLGLTNKKNYSVSNELKSFLTSLKDKGHTFLILSKRPNWDCLNEFLFDAITALDLDDAKIILQCNNKIKYLKENNIKYLIDLSSKINQSAKRMGIKTIEIDKNLGFYFQDIEN